MTTQELEYRARIEEMIDRGHHLDEVEEMIDRLPLDDESRAALSIWAWAWNESRWIAGGGGAESAPFPVTYGA